MEVLSLLADGMVLSLQPLNLMRFPSQRLAREIVRPVGSRW